MSNIGEVIDNRADTVSPVLTAGTTPIEVDVEMEDADTTQNNANDQDEMQGIQKHSEDEEQPDQSLSLPLSKIKRIFKMDPDYLAASQSAVYTAGLATELFVQYFVEQASLLAKMEKRKKIQYKDFANAVSTHDSLNFLSDTVPKTQSIGELINNKKVNLKGPETNNPQTVIAPVEKSAEPIIVKKDILAKGQQTLNFQLALAPREERPIKKAVIHDLVTIDDEED